MPVKVPLATREEGDEETDAAVEFGMMVEGMISVSGRYDCLYCCTLGKGLGVGLAVAVLHCDV